MSSTALQLVNKVLRFTGSYKQLTAIAGSVGGIGERIVEMLNLVIGDVESRTNWAALRSDSTGTGDGSTTIFEFVGADDVREDGPVSVTVGRNALQEMTVEQLDAVKATQAVTGQSKFFTRGLSATGNAQIEIYPAPAVGDAITMSAYKRATRLDATLPNGTTEFDDELLVAGAVMHMDAYEGQNRGYAQIYASLVDRRLLSNYAGMKVVTTVDSYK